MGAKNFKNQYHQVRMERWRLILDPDLEGRENMAVDEAIARTMDMGEIAGIEAAPPTLRLYGWQAPTISIGYTQDASRITGYGLPVVKRITGGRAVLHDMEVTYSVVTGSANPLFSAGIGGAYSSISGCIINALKDTGIDAMFSRGKNSRGDAAKDACFHTPSRYEVIVDRRKLVGSSQRRFKNSFIQHGSILFNIDSALNAAVFGPGVIERMAWIESFKKIDKDIFKKALIRRFSEGLGAKFEEGVLNRYEEKLKKDLLESRYSSGSTGVLKDGLVKGMSVNTDINIWR